MRRSLAATVMIVAFATSVIAQTPSIAPYIAPAFPEDLVAAKSIDRIAWLAYDHGQRNAYTAAAPHFKPVRITSFLDDDGIVLSNLGISEDGSIVSFLRGGLPNARGWYAVPTSNPNGGEAVVWAATTNGGGAWRLGRGSAPVLSPNGRTVAFTTARSTCIVSPEHRPIRSSAVSSRSSASGDATFPPLVEDTPRRVHRAQRRLRRESLTDIAVRLCPRSRLCRHCVERV